MWLLSGPLFCLHLIDAERALSPRLVRRRGAVPHPGPTRNRLAGRWRDGRPLLLLKLGELSDYETSPVSVALVADDDDSIFIRGKDKATLILRAIPAGVPTAQVEMTATDTWGRQVWADTIDVKGARVDRPIDLPTDKPGVFRVLLRATSPDGKLVGIGGSSYAIIEPPASEPEGEPRYFGWGGKRCPTPYGPWNA